MATRNSKSFAEWMREIESILAGAFGLSSDDLPDCCFADWFVDGVSPKSAAKRAIRAAQE